MGYFGLRLKPLMLLTIAILFVLLVSVASIQAYFSVQLNEYVVEQYNAQQLTLASEISSGIEQFINDVKDDLLLLSDLPLVQQMEAFECVDNIESICKRFPNKLFSVQRADKYGNVECSVDCDSSQAVDKVVDVSQEAFFQQAMMTEQPVIHNRPSNQTDPPQTIVTVPIFSKSVDTRKFEGVFIAKIDLDKINDVFIKPVNSGDKGYAWLMSSDGSALTKPYHTWSEPSSSGLKLPEWTERYYPQNLGLLKRMMHGESGVSSQSWDGQELTYTAFAPVNLGNSEGWSVAVTSSSDEVNYAVTMLQRRMLFSLLFTIGLLSVVLVMAVLLFKSKEQTEKKFQRAKITLEQLGITNLPKEISHKQATKSLLAHKKFHLIKECNRNHSLHLFVNAVKEGYAGLGISRLHPDKIKQHYNLKNTPFIWLSSSKHDRQAVYDVKDIKHLVEEFAQTNADNVILIDRLDYVITENGFEKTLGLIHELNDLVSTSNTFAIISVSPDAITKQQLALLELETQDLIPYEEKKKVLVSEQLHNIITFIHNQTLKNKLVTFKDVMMHFKITKPTTRAKISDLQNMNLVTVTQKGKSKTIALTQKGLNLL